eukprot:6480115-Amphidinium_carterae.3
MSSVTASHIHKNTLSARKTTKDVEYWEVIPRSIFSMVTRGYSVLQPQHQHQQQQQQQRLQFMGCRVVGVLGMYGSKGLKFQGHRFRVSIYIYPGRNT